MASIDNRNTWLEALADVGITTDPERVLPLCCVQPDGGLVGVGLQIIHADRRSSRIAFDVNNGVTLQYLAKRVRAWVDAGAGYTNEAHYYETLGQIEELEAGGTRH